ncbi:MAG: MarR family winged helix-turn-helix transcriptional regulator, partial [Jiangellaceae bacterium]
RDLAHDSGLSDADYDVLSTVSDTPDVDWRLRELADRLLWSPSRLSHHLSRMESRGLVERDSRPADNRGASIALTADGRRAIEAAAPHHLRSVRKHFIDLLTREQIDTLADIAETVVEHLNQRSDADAAR